MRPPVVGSGAPVESFDLGSLLLRPAAPRASAAFTPRQRPATAQPSTQQHGTGEVLQASDPAGPAARRPMTARPAAAALSARIEAARQRPQSGSVTARSGGATTARSEGASQKVAPERPEATRKDSAMSGGMPGRSGTDKRAMECTVEFVCQPDPRWDTLYVQARRELEQDAKVEQDYFAAMYAYGGKQISRARIDLNLREIAGVESWS
ncbi:hypothetical protein T484DRAFT_1929595 [Baffinella frigidus]|nr:hypothetical protein T484DRAFT_1929595 [Cryptophyta sp. CCMP2293]